MLFRSKKSEAYLSEAQRLSHTGSFGWNSDTGEIVWSDETYRIFEYDNTLEPTLDSIVQRVHPDAPAAHNQSKPIPTLVKAVARM